jgi:hypothetical protein
LEYWYNGNLRYKGKFREGRYHGNECVLFKENGEKEFEGQMYEGKMQGECVFYWDNGQVRFRGMCKEGAPNGSECELFSETGELVYSGGFKEGLYSGKGECFEAGKEHKGRFKEGKPFTIF